MSRLRHYELCNLHVNGRHSHTTAETTIKAGKAQWTGVRHAGNVPVLVSHTPADEPWAQWIALALRAAGHETTLEPAGSGFAQRLTEGQLSSTDTVLLLLSTEHRATDGDWAAIARSPTLAGRLLALRLDPAGPPPALRATPCRSLHGLDEEDALETILTLVGGIHRHPSGCPPPG